MSTCFYSAEEAIDYARSVLPIRDGLEVREVERQPVGPFGCDILLDAANDPGATEVDKRTAESIKKTMEAQRTYGFFDANDGNEHKYSLKEPADGMTETTIRLTIGPFREGFDCWVLFDGLRGIANRL